MRISENVSGADNQQGSLRDPSTTVRRTSFGMMRQSELPSDRKLKTSALTNHVSEHICLKGNGGAQRYPQAGWKSALECKGIRVLDCEAYKPSRDESRA
jgi:hypothetical protein